VESAFHTEVHNFAYNGRVFRANVKNARLDGEAGDKLQCCRMELMLCRPAVWAASLYIFRRLTEIDDRGKVLPTGILFE